MDQFDMLKATAEQHVTHDVDMMKRADEMQEALFKMRERRADSWIERWYEKGKLTPGAEPYARALLMVKPLAFTAFNVTPGHFFTMEDGTKRHITDMFIDFVEGSEPIPTPEAKVGLLSADQRALFSKLGVDPKKAVAHMTDADFVELRQAARVQQTGEGLSEAQKTWMVQHCGVSREAIEKYNS